ncbi:MAG: hypothetical protein NC347_12250 [Clostridium sp.]|nr:hypothetical protein [Clostridium sp.]
MDSINEKNMFNEKKVMVLSIIHRYDSVEVLGVFDDIEKLRQICHKIIQTDTYLQQDISYLHIYRCVLNHMFAEFYPDDYDEPDGEGCYLEQQEDICDEILGDEFMRELRMKQEEKKW